MMKRSPRSARRLRRLAVASLLVAAACGGRAASSSALGPGDGLFSPCDGACGGGSECISGLCTRSCDDDTECFDLSPSAICRHNFVLGEGRPRCEVECGTDEGCVNALGEGYHCGGAFCRAVGASEAVSGLASEFSVLEVARSSPEASLCPRALQERSKLNRDLSLLIWSTCDEGRSPTSDVSVVSGDSVLEPSDIEQVRDAYADVSTAPFSTECTNEASILTLDVEVEGLTYQYVDAANAGCPAGRIHRGSVTGLPHLREVLIDLRGAH
jgi:hypothetical protein